MLFIPVGGGPTIDARAAAQVVDQLNPFWVTPMHYGTPALDFLEPVDAFLAEFDPERVRRLDSAVFESGELDPAPEAPTVVVPAAPGG